MRACETMRPRLEAEESLLAVDRLVVGTGRVANPSGVLDRWVAIARPALRAMRKLMTRKAVTNGVPDGVSELGIGVHVVTK